MTFCKAINAGRDPRFVKRLVKRDVTLAPPRRGPAEGERDATLGRGSTSNVRADGSVSGGPELETETRTGVAGRHGERHSTNLPREGQESGYY